jgi:hypothetical protein
MFLENHRQRQMSRGNCAEEEKQWWERQRTYGLCQAIRSATEQNQLRYLSDRLKTPGGIRRLRNLIRNSFPKEYRVAS